MHPQVPTAATQAPIKPYFFFTTTPTTEIYTLSLHDALPIYPQAGLPADATLTAGVGFFAAVLKTARSEEHTSELQSHSDLVCRLLLEKKNDRVQHVGCHCVDASAPGHLLIVDNTHHVFPRFR